MDGVGPRDFGRAQDVGDVQVTFRGLGGADADPLVREQDMEGLSVDLRKDGDRLDAELPGGPDDPEGDLSAVGD